MSRKGPTRSKSHVSKSARLTKQIALIGLDNAGKTTLLHQFKSSEFVQTSPTVAPRLELVESRKIAWSIWDIPGAVEHHHLWPQHVKRSDVGCFLNRLVSNPLAGDHFRRRQF